MTQPFEIPEQLRELTERNIEQARVAYSQLMDAMVKSTGMWMAAMPSNGLTAGFKTFQDRAVLFAKQNAEAGFAVASELTNAKNIQDLLAIQSRYAQTQMQTFGIQAQQLAWLMADALRDLKPKS